MPWQHYDDYIARDVVQLTDRKYRTRADRRHRAIAGLSMGGYGAMALAFEYPGVFAAAASHSGVLAPLYMGPHRSTDIRGGPQDRATLEKSGATPLAIPRPRVRPKTRRRGGRAIPARRLERLVARREWAAVPALFADCGTEDALVDESRAFKWKAEQLGVPIAYHEWPGKHDWPYWSAHVGESLGWIGEQIGR